MTPTGTNPFAKHLGLQPSPAITPGGGSTIPNNARVTEAAAVRVTEAGDIRVTN